MPPQRMTTCIGALCLPIEEAQAVKVFPTGLCRSDQARRSLCKPSASPSSASAISASATRSPARSRVHRLPARPQTPRRVAQDPVRGHPTGPRFARENPRHHGRLPRRAAHRDDQNQPDKIGFTIGPGGKTIKGIVAEPGAWIHIEDDGIFAPCGGNAESTRARGGIRIQKDGGQEVNRWLPSMGVLADHNRVAF